MLAPPLGRLWLVHILRIMSIIFDNPYSRDRLQGPTFSVQAPEFMQCNCCLVVCNNTHFNYRIDASVPEKRRDEIKIEVK